MLSVGGTVVSSLGSDNGPEGQDGGGPLPTFDELTADYSSSTDGGLFPPTVNGSESLDSWIMNNDPTLFGDSDHVGGFSVKASGLWLLVPSNPSEDRPGKGGSNCSSDDSIAGVGRCEMEGDLSFLITTSLGAGSDGADQSGPQSLNLAGLNAPFGGSFLSGNYLNAQQIFEMIAAQNSFAMTWPWGMIQGAFPPPCVACDVTPPVVDDSFAPASDFVIRGGSLSSDTPPDPPGGGSLPNIGNARPAIAVPEIPPPAMLLIGFAGLALIGRRRLWGSTRLG